MRASIRREGRSSRQNKSRAANWTVSAGQAEPIEYTRKMQLKRVSRRVPVHVSREGGRSRITAVMCDVSRRGIFIGTLHPFPLGSRVEIRLTDKSRTFRTRGIVVQRSVSPAQLTDDQIPGMRVEVTLSAEQERELEEDRQPMSRADLSAPAVAFVGRERHSLEIKNISTTGAALTTDSDLAVTELVMLTFGLPRLSQGLAINGIVVRKEPLEKGSLVAVEFVDPSKQVVAAIDRYVSGSRA